MLIDIFIKLKVNIIWIYIIIYNDSDLKLDWGIDKVILSAKDTVIPIFKECVADFRYGEDK